MSHFTLIQHALRHAWFNFWDKYMITGRIN